MEFQFGFNRLEGDSLIQTRQLRGPGSQWLGRFNRLEGDSLIQTDSPPVETTSGAGFNRLEGDSLIQTNTAISAATTAFSSFNRLEGDSLIQTHYLYNLSHPVGGFQSP